MDEQTWRRHLGKLVSDHLTDHDLTRAEAARRAGIGESTLAKVIKGKRDLRMFEARQLGLIKPMRDKM